MAATPELANPDTTYIINGPTTLKGISSVSGLYPEPVLAALTDWRSHLLHCSTDVTLASR